MSPVVVASDRPTDDQVCDVAAAYRAALDRVDALAWADASITSFPRAACGQVSNSERLNIRFAPDLWSRDLSSIRAVLAPIDRGFDAANAEARGKLMSRSQG